MALVYPLGVHPTNKNEVIVWDCAFDPTALFALSADEIRTRMFTRADELPDGVSRLPIKTIHLNKSPVVVSNLKVLDAAAQERCGLDVNACLANAEKAARGVQQHDLSGVWADVFHRVFDDVPDVDEALYAGFVPADDRRLLEQLRLMTVEEIARANPHFSDERLAELVFRYRARNFPEALSAEETQEWQRHCFERLHPRVESYMTVLETLAETQDVRGQAVLDALSEYVFQIVPDDVY